jgi:hypothetical protein
MSNPFMGTWTYRSFLNNPAPVGNDPSKLQALLFAEAVWTVKDAADTVFEGELSFGPTDILDLKGVVTPAQADGRRTLTLSAQDVRERRPKSCFTIMTAH